MNRLSVRKQYNSQISTVHLRYTRPTANAAVLLNCFLNWIVDDEPNLLVSNYGAVGTLPDRMEILSALHFAVS